MPLSKLDQSFDLWLKVGVHEVVVEHTGCAAMCELVGVCLPQVVPWEGPMIQRRAYTTQRQDEYLTRCLAL